MQRDSVNLCCCTEDKLLTLSSLPEIPVSGMALSTFLIQVSGSMPLDLIYIYGQMLPSLVILWRIESSTAFENVIEREAPPAMTFSCSFLYPESQYPSNSLSYFISFFIVFVYLPTSNQ